MAFKHGKDTIFKVNSVDLSAYTNTSQFELGMDEHDVTCYGASGHAVAGGLQNGKVSFGGVYDSGTTGPRKTLQTLVKAGATITVVRQPEGTGSGKPQDSASVLLTKYVETAPVADMISWTCEGTVSGVVDITAQT